MLLKTLAKFFTNNATGLHQTINFKRIHFGTRKLSTSNNTFEEKKINVKGVDINYVKTGTGKHTVFLFTSTLGSIWTDFKPQIEGLDKMKFTVVGWDPPGYGKSRPPERDFSADCFARDAEYAYELMNTLGIQKFSLVGWSGGGVTAIHFAANYPHCVDKLVVISCGTHLSSKEMDTYKSMRDISKWSDKMKGPLVAIYGEEKLHKMWNSWADLMNEIFEHKKGDIARAEATKVKCPTLIVHGNKDIVVFPNQAAILNSSIRNSRVKIFEEGGHNVHLRFPDEFNNAVTEFLLEEN
ncbi:valacyclovir hydrolase-like [Microplitis mediator]|uniref:valacyclovir hydrolase-like n=1 Tax=Microplitis mediator TaxID=375433 RepID=UPI002552FA65|nr:valacyclovir hydrolase-like [Microplitis mediator]